MLVDFEVIRRRHIQACRTVLASGRSLQLSEAAFPAYSHPNPMINRLFWRRLRQSVEYLQACANLNVILDFGCGGCPMAPFASRIAKRVIAADVELGPAKAIAEQIPLPVNVELWDLQRDPLSNLPSESIDCVLALDVLEHVPDLGGVLGELHRLLRVDGKILVSGPTENVLYRVGRRLAGRDYTGDYHKRAVAEIRNAVATRWQVEDLRDVYPWFPLFKLFVGTRVQASR